MSEFAGTLSERISVERPVGGRTAMGVQDSLWEPVFSCLASIVPEGAGAESEAMALSAMPWFRVTIRKRDGIAIDQRINWRGKLMMVRQMLDDPRARDRIIMRCEEIRQ
jgi:SPP1 family predicted phage head-tail adaptor